MNPNQKPTVGRIVHIHVENEQPLAAIIVHVWNDTCVNVTAFSSNGDPVGKTSVLYGPGPGNWAWPPRN